MNKLQQHRYRNDPEFATLVNTLAHVFEAEDLHFSCSDVFDATVAAKEMIDHRRQMQHARRPMVVPISLLSTQMMAAFQRIGRAKTKPPDGERVGAPAPSPEKKGQEE